MSLALPPFGVIIEPYVRASGSDEREIVPRHTQVQKHENTYLIYGFREARNRNSIERKQAQTATQETANATTNLPSTFHPWTADLDTSMMQYSPTLKSSKSWQKHAYNSSCSCPSASPSPAAIVFAASAASFTFSVAASAAFPTSPSPSSTPSSVSFPAFPS